MASRRKTRKRKNFVKAAYRQAVGVVEVSVHVKGDFHLDPQHTILIDDSFDVKISRSYPAYERSHLGLPEEDRDTPDLPQRADRMTSRKTTQTRWLSRISKDANIYRWYLQTGFHDRMPFLLQKSTREYRHSLFRTNELSDCLHWAITHTNIDMLQFFVNFCEVPMEVTNKEGMTPLYKAVSDSWVEGAMFLLCQGASIQKADQSLSNASCRYPPLVHAVVETRNEILLREVINRGADISVRNLQGQNCLEAEIDIPSGMMPYIQEEMKKANPLHEESCPGALQMVQVARERGVYSCKDSDLVKDLIVDQHSQDPRKNKLLLGAWCVTRYDYARAFDCWGKLRPPLGSGVDGSMAFESAWAGILLVNDRGLLEEDSLSQDNELNYDTFTLLVIATYAPAGMNLTRPVQDILLRLQDHQKLATSLDVMKHLIAVRVLHKDNVIFMISMLDDNVCSLSKESETPFSLLLDSVMIASRCLSFLIGDASFSTDRGIPTRHDLSSDYPRCGLCTAMLWLIRIFLTTMSIYQQQGDSTSEEQQKCFSSHIRDFVCTFPWIRGKNVFHHIRENFLLELFTASSIKTLVALSAEARGTNRHQNMPIHLTSDKDGDTPLHVCARLLSGKDLIEEGVLQCFLDQGAHLCIRNNQGESVRDILVRRGLFTEAGLLPSLQCLAAAAFMRDANLREKVHCCNPQRVRHILLDH